MSRFAWIAVPVALGLALPTTGCGLFRRRANVNTSVSSTVQVDQTGRDVATLERHQYEVLETSIGINKSTNVFVLTIPVGSQTSHEEQVDSAYFAAVDRVKGCDAMLMPRVDTKRTVVPLLLVNLVIRKITVKGRCIHVKDDVDGAEGGSLDTGGGEEPVSAEAADGGATTPAP
jgi:hypothetical protein